MERVDELLIAVGRIEGQLKVFNTVIERVAKLEHWQYWQKGGLAVLAFAYAYLYHCLK